MVWKSCYMICFGLIIFIFLKGSTGTQNLTREKTYVFAFSNDGFPANFITKKGQLDGQAVRLVKKVCARSGRSCDVAVVPRADCWDTSTWPALSKVLDQGWFDACANLPPSSQRELGYLFGAVPYFMTPYPSLVVHPDSHITLDDLKTCNKLRLAFLDNLGLTPDCVLTSSYWLNECFFVRIPGEASLTKGTDNVVKAVLRGKADIGLVVTKFLNPKRVKILGTVPCSADLAMGLNIMMRKDNCALYNWWQDALVDFICHDNAEYMSFCEDLAKEFKGSDPLCLKPGVDIDCTSTDGKLKVADNTSNKIVRITPCLNQVPKEQPKYTTYKKGRRRRKHKKPIYSSESSAETIDDVEDQMQKAKPKQGKGAKKESESENREKSTGKHGMKGGQTKSNGGSYGHGWEKPRGNSKEGKEGMAGSTGFKNIVVFGGYNGYQEKMPSSYGMKDSPLANYFKSALQAKQEKKGKDQKSQSHGSHS